MLGWYFSPVLVLNIWLIWHENFLNMGRKGVSFEWSSRLVRRMILHNQDCSIQRAKCSNFAASKINGGGGMVNDGGAVCSRICVVSIWWEGRGWGRREFCETSQKSTASDTHLTWTVTTHANKTRIPNYYQSIER